MPSQKSYKYRILYVGRDLALAAFLIDELKRIDCFVVRCPRGTEARSFIASDINYSLLLFDDELPDMTGLALAHFTSERAHRKTTPVVILSAEKARGMVAGLFFEKPFDVDSLVQTITARLQDSKSWASDSTHIRQ
jgi:DNA-binding response OmpR family regulator